MDKYLKKLNKKARKNFNIKKKHLNKLKLEYSLNSFRILGQYSPKNKTIYINQKLVDKVGEKAYYEIFRHEYGHFITDILYPYAAAHGREWKNIMRILGDRRPSATNSNFSNKIRKAYKDSFVKVECKCSEFKISNNKATRIENKTSKYRCPYCKSKIKIKQN